MDNKDYTNVTILLKIWNAFMQQTQDIVDYLINSTVYSCYNISKMLQSNKIKIN